MRSPQTKSPAKSVAVVEQGNALPANDTLRQHSVEELQQSAGNQALLRLLSGGGTMLQKKGKDGGADSGAASQAEGNQAAVAVGPSLIVEDDADVKPGQMRKTEFLSQLRNAACSAAEQALSGTMWSCSNACGAGLKSGAPRAK
jgi:hypothetical protein